MNATLHTNVIVPSVLVPECLHALRRARDGRRTIIHAALNGGHLPLLTVERRVLDEHLLLRNVMGKQLIAEDAKKIFQASCQRDGKRIIRFHNPLDERDPLFREISREFCLLFRNG